MQDKYKKYAQACIDLQTLALAENITVEEARTITQSPEYRQESLRVAISGRAAAMERLLKDGDVSAEKLFHFFDGLIQQICAGATVSETQGNWDFLTADEET